MKYVLLKLIAIYQGLISPVLAQVFGIHCRYELTCSAYAKKSIESNGVLKGLSLSFKRILSCQPYSKRYEYS